MKELAKAHQDKLEEHKKMVEAWHQYFRFNNERFWEFTKFVCASTLSSSDIAALNTLDKPTVEFNILEAMVSRLRADFAKQEPSFEVRAADGVPLEALTPEFTRTEQVIESYLRAIFDDATNDGLQSNINSDQLIGGFSVVWVRTDYVNEFSFEQNIIVERVFDPTLTFFDPMARTSHKGDGGYCGMMIPYTKDRFIKEFGEEAAKDIKFNKSDNIQGFNWSYQSQDQDIVLVAYMFEKKFKRTKIVKLSNGHVVPMDHYKELLERWDIIEQPPVILEERWTQVESIVHYQFCENKELAFMETDYKFLPLIFVDGNSVLVRGDVSTAQTGSAADSSGGATQQMTRPYVYHAKDAQRSKNFAGQTMMAAIENISQAQFMVSVEAIPEDYQEAYKNPQQANILVYNAFDDKTGERLDAPREVQKIPTPQIVESAFMNANATIQMTLGSYDAQQGIVGDNLSGKAIMQGAMQSDGAAGPYLINYIKAWNRIGQIVIDLIPKYYRTPRSLPIIGPDGKRSFQIVNNEEHEGNVSMDYDPHSLQIKIEAGVNSAVQKQLALDMIIKMMGSSELFNQFINTMGLEVLLDNMDIRNIDHLKSQAAEFMQQMKQQQEQAAQQPNPVEMEMETIKQIEMAKVQQRQQQAEGELSIKAAEVAVKQEVADLQYMKLMAEIEEGSVKAMASERKSDAEEARAAVDLALEMAKLHHEENRQEE
jgi:hypothetical protein